MSGQCDYLLGYEASATTRSGRSHTPTGRRSIRSPIRPSRHQRGARWRRQLATRRRAVVSHEKDAVSLDAMLVAADGGQSRRMVRELSCLSVLSGLHVLRPRLSGGPIERGAVRLLRLPAGPEAASRRSAAGRQPSTAYPRAGASHTSSHRAGTTAATTSGRWPAIDARLTREIRRRGRRRNTVRWMDEWFKRNWVVIDFEIPAENTRQWHNVMDAEQNYGLLGQYAGAAEADPEPGRHPGALARTSADRKRRAAASERSGRLQRVVRLSGDRDAAAGLV